ncbi:MAG: tetratricopeptide repeat protein [Pseudomonadota bacterium]
MSVWLKYPIKYSFISIRRLLLCLFFTMMLMQLSCQSLRLNKDGQTELDKQVNLTSKESTANSLQAHPEKKAPPQKVKLPNVQLTEQILFKYVLGELAKQHNDYETAFNNFISLSESTGDPRIAKSALRVALFLDNDVKIFKAVQLWAKLELQSGSKAIDTIQIQAIILLKVKQDELVIQNLLAIFKEIDNQQAMVRIGVILSSLNDYSRLKQILSTLKSAFSNDYYVNLYSAKFALKFSDYLQAEKDINQAIAIEPKDDTAYLLKSTLYKKMGQQDKVLKVYQEAIGQLDNPSLIRLEYTRDLLELKRRQDALEQLEIIVEENNEDNHILYSIGMLAMDINEYDQARIFFTKLYQLDGNEEQGAFLLGVLAYQEEKNDLALRWFNKIKSKKYLYESVLRKAIILSEQKHYNMAVELLDDYLITRLLPEQKLDAKKQLNLLRLKADILNQALLFNKAYDTYTDALTGYPNHVELLYSRAMVAEKLGRIDSSENDLLLIIKMDPKNSNALNALGFILTEKTTRYEDAKKYIEMALQISPNDMAILDSMGWVLYKLGKMKEALTYLKQAYNIKQDPEIAAHYGEVLWFSEQKEQAKQIWQSALKKDPHHEVLKSTMINYLKQQ